ncbi:hypothetical protein, partial [Microcystis sp. M074S1]
TPHTLPPRKTFCRKPYLGFAAKSLLVGLGVSSRSSVAGRREFQALLPSLFCTSLCTKRRIMPGF